MSQTLEKEHMPNEDSGVIKKPRMTRRVRKTKPTDEPVQEPAAVAKPSAPPIKKGIKLSTIRSIAIGLILLVVGMGMGYQYRGAQDSGFTSLPHQVVPLDRSNLDFTQFWNVWDKLSQEYVDPNKLDSKKMIDGAIQGMTSSLGDPYTMYLPPQANTTSKQDLNGQFEGVGIELGYKQGSLAVQTPLTDLPAFKAGVKAGDLILHIKDQGKNFDKDTTGMSLQDAVNAIRGKRGTQVTLTFFREGKGTFDKTITREQITMPSVELVIGDLKDGKWQKSDAGTVAWIRLYRFGDTTQEQWDNAVSTIQAKRNQLKGVVLDVRNNPGGLLDTAINLASDFIPDGLIVEQQGRYDSQSYKVSRRARLLGMPLTVMINGGSASASEILAGALRDRLSVKLIGEKSFGKGTVQQALDLPGGAGLHVTIAKWLLPNGDWIHGKGLQPAIEVKLPETATDSAQPVEDTQLETAAAQFSE